MFQTIYENSFSYNFVYPHILTGKTKSHVCHKNWHYVLTVQSYQQFLHHKSFPRLNKRPAAANIWAPFRKSKALEDITMFNTYIGSVMTVFK